MKNALVLSILLCVVLMPVCALAQGNVVVDAGLVGGTVGVRQTTPADPAGMVSGSQADTNGFFVRGQVVVAQGVSVGMRIDRVNIVNPQYVYGDALTPTQTGPDGNVVQGQLRNVELFAKARVAFGQYLVVGYNRLTDERTSQYQQYDERTGLVSSVFSRQTITHSGPIVGLGGGRESEKLIVEYEALAFPWSTRESEVAQAGVNNQPLKTTARGFAVSGQLIYKATEHLGLLGGYEYRRMSGNMLSSSDNPVVLTAGQHTLRVGLRARF